MINLTNLKLLGNNIPNPSNRDVFNRYLSEIARYKPLSRDEEVELFKQLEVNKDSRDVIDKIFKHNLLFVVSVAKKFAIMLSPTSPLTLEDLINEGNIGLHTAINKFDYKTGNKFITYAVWWIKQSIITIIQNHVKSIRIPSNVRIQITYFNKTERKLEQIMGRDVTTLEVFESMIENEIEKELPKTNGSLTNFEYLINANSFEKSLNSFVGDGDMEMINMFESNNLSPDETLINNEREELVRNMLSKLPNDVQSYFIDFYGLYGKTPLSYHELSNKYGDSRQKYVRIIKNNLKKMKVRFESNKEFYFPKKNIIKLK